MTLYHDSVGNEHVAEIVTEHHRILAIGGDSTAVAPGDILIHTDTPDLFDIVRGKSPEDMGWTAPEDIENDNA